MRRDIVLRVLAAAIVVLGVALALSISDSCIFAPSSGGYVRMTPDCTSRSFERIAIIGGAVVVGLGVFALSVPRRGSS